MQDAPVEHVDFLDALIQRIEGGIDLRNHPFRNLPVRNHGVRRFFIQRGNPFVVNHHARHIAQINQLFRRKRRGDVARRVVRVDVV